VGSFTWPEQNFYCRGDIKSVEDLKGKKIRVQGVSQADLVKGFGASAVTIAFGEVVPALETGVVDCGITGTMPAYKAKWTEVTNTLFRLPVGFTAALWLANTNAWDKLSPATQEFLKKEFKVLEDKSWKTVEAETEDGVYCTTGTGNCPAGPPGKLKLVKPSESGLKACDKVLNEVVLKEWAKRCGEVCAAKWTEIIGKKYGLAAKTSTSPSMTNIGIAIRMYSELEFQVMSASTTPSPSGFPGCREGSCTPTSAPALFSRPPRAQASRLLPQSASWRCLKSRSAATTSPCSSARWRPAARSVS
jgi:Bacterial extracellular solute-binding protein, family 7